MAAVIGPNTMLPGQKFRCDPGYTCDEEGCGLNAVHAVVGETDSFGSEIMHFCEAHYQKYLTEIEAHEKEDPDSCDHCNSKDSVKPFRDPAEGMCGPVYYLCAECRTRISNDWNYDVDDNTDSSDDIDDALSDFRPNED